jgi:hypothetical protein
VKPRKGHSIRISQPACLTRFIKKAILSLIYKPIYFVRTTICQHTRINSYKRLVRYLTMVITCHRFQARHGDARAGRGARGFTSSARGYTKWTAVEDSKLKDAVQTHGDKDWGAISALVPGRTRRQCWHRWYDILDPIIALTAGRKGKWTEDEDSKLEDAVQTHGGKDWVAICARVPGRTRNQCKSRWHDTLAPSIGRASGRKGKWTGAEDSQLTHAVQTYGDKDWVALSVLVPGRTKKQCWDRWRRKKHLDPNRTTVRKKDNGTLKKAPAVGRDPQSTRHTYVEFMD